MDISSVLSILQTKPKAFNETEERHQAPWRFLPEEKLSTRCSNPSDMLRWLLI